MKHNAAKEPETAWILLHLHLGAPLILFSMVFCALGTNGLVYSQGGPPPDPELNSATAKMSSFERVLKSHPGDSAARKGEVDTAVTFSLAEKREHREEAALWLLLRARYWVPDDPELLVDLGIQEDNLKLFVDADAALAESLRIRPDDLNALYTVARVKMDLGQMQSAEQAWLLYIKHDPGNPAAYYGYGIVLQSLGRDDEGRRQFEKSIQLNPNQAESHYRIGEIERHSGNAADARKEYGEVLARDPTHGGALTGLAILDYELKKYDQAETGLEAAIKSVPNYRPARYYHGLTLARLGRKKEADAELSLAMQLGDKKEQQRRLVAQPYQPN
jgi:tetratricopeptide (TPR) repeat protein